MSCPTGEDISRAASIIREGGLVAFPTETVYGLGAAATNVQAVARLFAAKERPEFDPLIVHLAELDWLDQLAIAVPDPARRLIDRFWPGPLTLVLPKHERVPDLVTSGLPTVALRMPDHPVALRLLREAGVPIAAPSANKFGRISPTCAEHVVAQLGDEIDYVLDGGACRVGIESTVVSLVGEHADRPRVLRLGGLSVEAIEAVIGPVDFVPGSCSSETLPQAAPGMLEKHYAPRTPLVVEQGGEALSEYSGKRIGWLGFRDAPTDAAYAAVEVLSPVGDLVEAAANFFAALRRLDDQQLDLIVAEPLPEQGLGRALNDRLRRASHV